MGGGGGDAGSVADITIGILLFDEEEEEVSCCDVWVCPESPVCWVPACSELDGDV